MSSVGIVGICGVSMTIVFVDNVSNGKDPFTPLVAGGIFTAGCVGIGQIEPEFGEAIAWVFLLSNLLLKSNPILNFFLGLSGAGNAQSASQGPTVRKPNATNEPRQYATKLEAI